MHFITVHPEGCVDVVSKCYNNKCKVDISVRAINKPGIAMVKG